MKLLNTIGYALFYVCSVIAVKAAVIGGLSAYVLHDPKWMAHAVVAVLITYINIKSVGEQLDKVF